MNINRFEDIEVWKKGMRLATKIYNIFKSCSDFGLRNQIQRSVVSIPSNIAERYERKSNKEFIQFLYIAKGSCAELRTQLYLAYQIGALNKVVSDELIEATRKVLAMLYNLIKVRKDKF